MVEWGETAKWKEDNEGRKKRRKGRGEKEKREEKIKIITIIIMGIMGITEIVKMKMKPIKTSIKENWSVAVNPATQQPKERVKTTICNCHSETSMLIVVKLH